MLMRLITSAAINDTITKITKPYHAFFGTLHLLEFCPDDKNIQYFEYNIYAELLNFHMFYS